MRGSSRASMAQAAERLEAVLPTAEAQHVGSDLFAAAGALRGSARLRRALTDPSRAASERSALVSQLFGGKIGQVAVEALQGVFANRWSNPDDAVLAVDELGIQSVLADAERSGKLAAVAEELFFMERALDAHADLSRAVAAPSRTVEERLGLLRSVFGGRVCEQALVLAEQGLHRGTGSHLADDLRRDCERAVERQNRSIARVESAIPLTDEQLARLQTALERSYGRAIAVSVDVVPEMMGGLKITVADEVIDASVLNRLDAARRRFTE